MSLQDNAKKPSLDIRPKAGSSDSDPRAPRYEKSTGWWTKPAK